MLNDKYLTQWIEWFLTLLRYRPSPILNRNKSALHGQDEYFACQSDSTFGMGVANL